MIERVALVLLGVTAGCAGGVRHIELSYDASLLPDADVAEVQFTLNDDRASRVFVANVPDPVTSSDVLEWIGSALRAGSMPTAAAHATPRARVDVTVEEVWCSAIARTLMATVRVAARIERAGSVMERRYAGTGRAERSSFGSERIRAGHLQRALNQALTEVALALRSDLQAGTHRIRRPQPKGMTSSLARRPEGAAGAGIVWGFQGPLGPRSGRAHGKGTSLWILRATRAFAALAAQASEGALSPPRDR